MSDAQTTHDNESSSTETLQLPWAAIIWGVVSLLLIFVSFQVVTLKDEQRFPDDFELALQDTDGEYTIELAIVNGTFRFDEEPFVPDDVITGTFTADEGYNVTEALFSGVPDLVEVQIEAQEMRLRYDNDIEPDAMLERARRPFVNAVLNGSETIEGFVAEDAENTFVFTTTDDVWRYNRYTPELIPEGEQEVYANREEGERGSALAQSLFEDTRALEALTINPDSLVVTYRDGAVENQVINRLEETLDTYHPRASLQPNLWLVLLGTNRVIDVIPINTGMALYVFTLVITGLELLAFTFYRGTGEKLLRPLLRVLSIFFFFWSIYGHEPLWDYMLGLLFPTSPQLVHPSGTVIEFTAQHLELVFVSSLITIPAGLLFGILVTRSEFREVLPLVNNLVNSGQTVPTIAIVALMAPIIGFGFWPAIIALIAYGLLPVVRNTIAGLEAVDDSVIDSARGMGMTPGQILRRIELPIASNVIMAGIRTSMVINVGTATLGAFVGSGGLGTPIASGLSMTVDAFIVLGAVPAALLAILIDYVLGRIEFILTPLGLQVEV